MQPHSLEMEELLSVGKCNRLRQQNPNRPAVQEEAWGTNSLFCSAARGSDRSSSAWASTARGGTPRLSSPLQQCPGKGEKGENKAEKRLFAWVKIYPVMPRAPSGSGDRVLGPRCLTWRSTSTSGVWPQAKHSYGAPHRWGTSAWLPLETRCIFVTFPAPSSLWSLLGCLWTPWTDPVTSAGTSTPKAQHDLSLSGKLFKNANKRG